MCKLYFPALISFPSIFTSLVNSMMVFSFAPDLQGAAFEVPKPKLFKP